MSIIAMSFQEWRLQQKKNWRSSVLFLFWSKRKMHESAGGLNSPPPRFEFSALQLDHALSSTNSKIVKAVFTSTTITFRMRRGGNSFPLAVVARMTVAWDPFMPAWRRWAVPWPVRRSLMDVEDRWRDNSSMQPI